MKLAYLICMDAQKKILWAVDVFGENTELERRCAEIALSMPCMIEPVYVLNPDDADLAFEKTSVWLGQYIPAVRRAFNFKLDRLLSQKLSPQERRERFLQNHIIVSQGTSLQESVGALLSYANGGALRLLKPQMILVGSHSRSGLKRLIVGSFAETLVQYSSYPVMIVGSHSNDDLGNPGDWILHPTDYQPKSLKAYDESLNLAKVLNKKIVLYHVVTDPLQMELQSSAYLEPGGWVPNLRTIPMLSLNAHETLRITSRAWARRAKTRGVEVKVETERSRKTVNECILHYSKRPEIAFVSMASQKGELATLFTGSVSRKVIRASEKPVWVLKSA